MPYSEDTMGAHGIYCRHVGIDWLLHNETTREISQCSGCQSGSTEFWWPSGKKEKAITYKHSFHHNKKHAESSRDTSTLSVTLRHTSTSTSTGTDTGTDLSAGNVYIITNEIEMTPETYFAGNRKKEATMTTGSNMNIPKSHSDTAT